MSENFNFGSLREKASAGEKNIASLEQWMRYIFPDEEIVFDEAILSSLWETRGPDVKYHRYRPDARIERLNLLIEVDGIAHYQDVDVILRDIEKNDVFSKLGYTLVRIPLYIQFTKSIVKHYFDRDIEQGCIYECGFYSLNSNPKSLNPCCPANFCSLGIKRFLSELRSLPKSDLKSIMQSLAFQAEHNAKELVLPCEVDISEFQKMFKETGVSYE